MYGSHFFGLESFFELRFQKLYTIHRNIFLGWLKLSPYRSSLGNHFHIRCKGLDYNTSVVFNFIQGSGDLIPVNVVASGCASITATSLEMKKFLTGLANCAVRIFLFYIHVISV